MRNRIYYVSNRPNDRTGEQKKKWQKVSIDDEVEHIVPQTKLSRTFQFVAFPNLDVNSSSSSTHHPPIAICHFYFRCGSSPSALISKQIKLSVGLVKRNETGQNKQAIWIERWWRTFHNFLRHPNILLCVSVGRFRFIFSRMFKCIFEVHFVCCLISLIIIVLPLQFTYDSLFRRRLSCIQMC